MPLSRDAPHPLGSLVDDAADAEHHQGYAEKIQERRRLWPRAENLVEDR